jgi:hypothetical protein
MAGAEAETAAGAGTTALRCGVADASVAGALTSQPPSTRTLTKKQ